MADPVKGTPAPLYEDASRAPFVYFDVVAAFGVLAGAIQIELAARTLTPVEDNGTLAKFVATGHLRCSPAAAAVLIDTLQRALAMLQQPQEPPPVGSKLN